MCYSYYFEGQYYDDLKDLYDVYLDWVDYSDNYWFEFGYYQNDECLFEGRYHFVDGYEKYNLFSYVIASQIKDISVYPDEIAEYLGDLNNQLETIINDKLIESRRRTAQARAAEAVRYTTYRRIIIADRLAKADAAIGSDQNDLKTIPQIASEYDLYTDENLRYAYEKVYSFDIGSHELEVQELEAEAMVLEKKI